MYYLGGISVYHSAIGLLKSPGFGLFFGVLFFSRRFSFRDGAF